MFNWEAIKEVWPFALIFSGYVIRTERQRAVFAEKHRSSEKSTDAILLAVKDAMTETRDMNKEMRADIKHLLERGR